MNLREFAADVDFSRWVSIWFYEEVKHYYSVRRWLHTLGMEIDEVAPPSSDSTAPRAPVGSSADAPPIRDLRSEGEGSDVPAPSQALAARKASRR